MIDHKETYVSHETGLLAKEVGFDWLCREYYYTKGNLLTWNYFEGNGYGWQDNSGIAEDPDYYQGVTLSCTAPTQAFLREWIMLEHNIYVDALPCVKRDDSTSWEWGYHVFNIDLPLEMLTHEWGFKTYNTALESALNAALNFIKNKDVS